MKPVVGFSKIKQWLSTETGFQVFENTALMLGGVSIALFVGAAVLTISGYEYTRVENEVIGNEVEAYTSLERFY